MNENNLEEAQSEINACKAIVGFGDDVAELKACKGWETIIERMFLKAYRETSAYNVGVLTSEQKEGYMYQITARSIFERFIDGIEEDAKDAKEALPELEESLIEDIKAEEEEQ